MKIATINEDRVGVFTLDYEDTLGRPQQMRLDADDYEAALREARKYLSIDSKGKDNDGHEWLLE